MRKDFFVWDILYPKRCAVCDRVLKQKEQYVCTDCICVPRKITRSFCLKCGKCVSGAGVLCERCKREEHTFQEGRAAFIYDSAMRRSMKRFKYEGRQEYADFYGSVLYEMFGTKAAVWGADAVVPVPVHTERLRKRGYNQAALLAKEFGRRAGLPVYEELLQRVKNTAPQKELTERERLRNLCQAFCVNKKVWELSKWINCVIIIDDIYTTGSTIEACSRALKAFGVLKIYFLCVCTGQGD